MLVFSVTVRQREMFFVLKKIRSSGELTNWTKCTYCTAHGFPSPGFQNQPRNEFPYTPPPPPPGGMAEKPSRSIICICNICNKGRVPRIASYAYMSPFARSQSHAC